MVIEHRYNLSQTAKELGVSRRTLYYWIERGLIPEPHNTLSGNRYYTIQEILKIKANDVSNTDKVD